MLNKKLMMLTIFIISLLAITAVSAADNATDDIVSIKETSDDFVNVVETTDEVASVEKTDVVNVENVNETVVANDCQSDELIEIENQSSNEIGVTEENELSATTGTFTDLANEIANADGELNLKKNYIYSSADSSYKNGITINKKIIINGNGFTIDGNSQARAFIVNSDQVILKNINFVKCIRKSVDGAYDNCSVINWIGNDGHLVNCHFVNCSASSRIDDGNVVMYIGDNGYLVNCSFVNYFTQAKGAGVYYEGNNGSFINCYFKNCSSITSGSAIYYAGINASLVNCSFINCSCIDSEYGGAVHLLVDNCYLINCSFINCLSLVPRQYNAVVGGLFLYSGVNAIIVNCSFVNCSFVNSSSSQGAGAVCLGDYFVNASLVNCSFVSCSSSSSSSYNMAAGAVFCRSRNSSLINCFFMNCSSLKGPGAVQWCVANNGYLVNCSFVNCFSSSGECDVKWTGSYNGYLVNCISDNNLVSGSGFKILYISMIKLNSVNEINFGEKVVINPIISNGATGNIKIFVDGIYKMTIGVGETFTLTNLNEGYHNISAIYEGDEHYESCENTTILKVNKDITQLIVSSVTTTYNIAKKLVVTLKDSNGVLEKKTVTVKVGTISKTLTTNSKGEVSVDISTLVPKAYTASIKFAGTSKYAKATTTAKVTVKKATPKFVASAKAFKLADKTKKYVVTMKTNQNKPLRNVWVYIKVNGKTYSAKTLSTGQAVFKLTKLNKVGSFTAAISFKGNNYYNKLNKNVKITVKK